MGEHAAEGWREGGGRGMLLKGGGEEGVGVGG